MPASCSPRCTTPGPGRDPSESGNHGRPSPARRPPWDSSSLWRSRRPGPAGRGRPGGVHAFDLPDDVVAEHRVVRVVPVGREPVVEIPGAPVAGGELDVEFPEEGVDPVAFEPA